MVQDKDKKRLRLTATNWSERLRFDKYDSKLLHKALIKGGTIRFIIREVKTQTTEYKFTVQSDCYNNIYRKLRERRKK